MKITDDTLQQLTQASAVVRVAAEAIGASPHTASAVIGEAEVVSTLARELLAARKVVEGMRSIAEFFEDRESLVRDYVMHGPRHIAPIERIANASLAAYDSATEGAK